MTRSFSEIFKQLKQPVSFTTCCSLFLNFQHSKSQESRLVILYILYSHYANLPLEQNPFLDFFLNLLENGTTIERHCIDLTRLIDDPTVIILNDAIVELLSKTVTNRTLTLSEHEALSKEKLSDYPLEDYIQPNQLPSLIEFNQFLAFDILPLLLKSDQKPRYLQAILDTNVTSQSIETIHHILVHRKMNLSQDFIHYYISNSIRSCEQLEGLKRDKQVKQVARFIQSLLEEKVIVMTEYFIEIQAFCISFMRIKGVVQLFRLASNEARQMQ
ncbi:unnamed protein product [Rhizopus stolonifer]